MRENCGQRFADPTRRLDHECELAAGHGGLHACECCKTWGDPNAPAQLPRHVNDYLNEAKPAPLAFIATLVTVAILILVIFI